ncbi:Activator of 90 kDa heat shock protein ATPase-like [Gracilariopsis chorda]|uniref:Activator of 90 kDa heat shock protein ATPase-like n=1 Tax=Gracilariopsis chorda TaxID=448386 RepID=A0A2V3IPV0_9FLOR|nr:Activator of 90 kDa heat shock protein ATPase-like [Gracilariopsis chorda]|eukprot:PXF44098.1 Activator of 90 kDa heat shock protein ATPase-like [Gracilariopsis chorda]
MALRGEGDPRWVVRERQDGRNVNSWHWEDKDVTNWAQQRIKQLITPESCVCSYNGTTVAVKSVDTVDGDATLYNRKGVLKVLYDLKVVGKWTTLHGEEEQRTLGEFRFELFDEEPHIVVSIDDKAPQKDGGAKECFVRNVTPLIKKECGVFITEMHAGAGQQVDGLQKASNKKECDTKVTDYLRSGMNQKAAVTKESNVSELILKDVFTCSGMDMYLALTDARRLEAITRAKAVSEGTVGGNVRLMNGEVTGRYKRLEEAKKIEMEWKLGCWGEGADAGVATIGIDEEDGKTEVSVVVSGVPKAMASKTEGFWRVQMLQAMKVVMGWGSASKFL